MNYYIVVPFAPLLILQGPFLGLFSLIKIFMGKFAMIGHSLDPIDDAVTEIIKR